jgi:hypothetical protein
MHLGKTLGLRPKTEGPAEEVGRFGTQDAKLLVTSSGIPYKNYGSF